MTGSDPASTNICLSDDLSVQLGKVGVTLENGLHHAPQDIEWAIKDGHIYIVQVNE